MVTYSSIMLGTAGTVICAVTTALRYNRRAIASRSMVGLKDLTAGSSIRLFYTTQPSFHQRPDLGSHSLSRECYNATYATLRPLDLPRFRYGMMDGVIPS